MDMLEKTLDYLDNEYKDFRMFLSRQIDAPSIPSRDEERALIDRTAKSTLSRCMGVVMFVQSIGVNYNDIKEPYEVLKQEINQLTKTVKESIR